MRRKLLVALFCLAISVCVMACGSKDNSTEQIETNSITEVTETVETEVVATESVETTGVQESETEVIEIEETETMTEENQTTASAMGSVNREDFVILDESWGYSNYVDYVEATRDRLSEAIIGYHSIYNNGQIDGNYGEDAVTNKGIRLGSTKEEVIYAYGTTPYVGGAKAPAWQVEGHYGVEIMQYEYLESPTHHYYLYFVYDENDILVGMCTSCWLEQ